MEEKIVDDLNIIGNNIRRIRTNRGMGQTELIRLLQLADISMTRETLVKIERGIQHIKLSQLRGIKEIFGVGYEEMLE